jgi:hypothetical protein
MYTTSGRKAVIFVSLALLTTFIGSAVFYQISFRGLQLEETQVNAGDELEYSANIVNLGSGPYTDVQVRASLVRESDRTQMLDTVLHSDVDLAAREIITLNDSLQIPQDTPAGDYNLIVTGNTPTGNPMSYISKRITVNNDEKVKTVQFGKEGLYLSSKRVVIGDNVITTYELPTYGSQGENILPGTNFSINFELENPGDQQIDPQAEIEIIPTYSSEDEPVKTIEKDLEALSPGEMNNYSIQEQMDSPGTYRVVARIESAGEEELASSEVRLVIAGEGGSIVNVENSRDTYGQGDIMRLNASIVGPADGSSVVEDAYLRTEVLKDGETVLQSEKTIDRLPLSTTGYEFREEVPEQLGTYTLRVELGKDDVVYDTFEAQYEPLTAEKRLTSDGQVWQQNQCFDDGECTQREYELGNCYDCIGVEEPPANQTDSVDDEQDNLTQIAVVVGVAAVLVLAVLGYRRWSQ